MNDQVTEEFQKLKQGLRTGFTALYQGFDRQLVQIESYLSLLSFLQPRFPFPALEISAIAPDLALSFASRILDMRPSVILELGSGVSTLIAGYALQRNKHGKVISIEHHEEWGNGTANSIRQHGLNDCVELVRVPLVDVTIQDQHHQWYDTSFLKNIAPRSINLFLVDGPPGTLQKLARYPALPIVHDYLADDAVVIVDDGDREDEKEMVGRWLREFPGFQATYWGSAKGTWILTRSNTNHH